MNAVSERNTDPMQTISKRLSEKGLRRVLIIDDAFDPPSRDDFDGTELAEFWAELDPDVGEQSELLTGLLGSFPESEDDLDDRAVNILYEHRNELGSIQTLFDQRLRAPLERKHAGLDLLKNHLGELGLDVKTSGTNVTFSDKSDLIFLDYYLGLPGDLSVKLSIEALTRQLRNYPIGENRPLIVLMSSHEDVARLAERFRDETGIVGGMFYFVPKPELSNRVKLLLNLDMLADALPAGHHIQGFIDVVESKCSSMTKQFISAIKSLNLDDYVYIQRLSLQADGHPLGDYLLWLYSAYFGHLLFERGLKEERRSLDRADFKGWIPSHAVPSRQLTLMYFAALFDTSVGPLDEHHPRWRSNKDGPEAVHGSAEPSASNPAELPSKGETKTVASGYEDVNLTEAAGSVHLTKAGDPSVVSQHPHEGEAISPHQSVRLNGMVDPSSQSSEQEGKEIARQLPYFNMGDVFLQGSTGELLMVLNPACDLEFVPDDMEGKRLLDPSDSLVLIPGTLEELEKAAATTNLRTELFVHNNRSYFVQWHPRRLKTITFDGAERWLLENGFARVARLRIPFSLQIQHRFAADFTRVGVPVPPPFYRSLAVQLFKRGEDGGIVAVPLNDPSAETFVMHTHRDGEMCVLTTGMVLALQRYLEEMSKSDSLLPPVEGSPADEIKRYERAQKRLNSARRFTDDFLAWRDMAVPFPLPKAGEYKSFDKTGVIIGYEVPTVGRWTNDSLLMVRISEIISSAQDEVHTQQQPAAVRVQTSEIEPSRSDVALTGSSTFQSASDEVEVTPTSSLPVRDEQLNTQNSGVVKKGDIQP